MSLLDERGAVRTVPEGWTPYTGLIQFPTDAPHGYAALGGDDVLASLLIRYPRPT